MAKTIATTNAITMANPTILLGNRPQLKSFKSNARTKPIIPPAMNPTMPEQIMLKAVISTHDNPHTINSNVCITMFYPICYDLANLPENLQ